jgi:hypothetical protein
MIPRYLYASLLATPAALLAIAALTAVQAQASVFADIDLQATQDDNVGRSEKSADMEHDRSVQLAARAGQAVELAPGTRLALGASLRALEFRRFRDLSEVSAGAAASLRHKFGLGPDAFSIALLADGEFIDSDSDIRDGERYGLGLRAGTRVGDRWGVSATLRHDWRDADEDEQNLPPNRPTFPGVIASKRGDVFEFDATELALAADYQFDNGWMLLASWSLRDGDVVSTARPNATIVGAAKAISSDVAFGPGRSAYRLDALTHTTVVGLNFPLAETASLQLDYEYQLSDADAGIRYDKNLLRLRLMCAY